MIIEREGSRTKKKEKKKSTWKKSEDKLPKSFLFLLLERLKLRLPFTFFLCHNHIADSQRNQKLKATPRDSASLHTPSFSLPFLLTLLTLLLYCFSWGFPFLSSSSIFHAYHHANSTGCPPPSPPFLCHFRSASLTT
jgi:hypothetical protein